VILLGVFLVVLSGCTSLEGVQTPAFSKYSIAERADYLVNDLLVAYSTYDFKALDASISSQCSPTKKFLLKTTKKQKEAEVNFRAKYSIDKVVAENGALHVFVTWEKQFNQTSLLESYTVGACELVFVKEVLNYRLTRVHGESPFVSSNILE